MPRSRESLNFLQVSSLLHVASEVLIKTVQSVTSRLNTTLENLLNLRRHSFFHSWKTQECCQCDQPFKNSTSILSSQEWNLLFQKTDEDCERATSSPNVCCSCSFKANNAIDPESLTINMSSCILEKSEGLKDNEIRNVQKVRDINEQLVQRREEPILTEESFNSFTDDLNKALHGLSKQCGDEFYNDVVERIQRIDASEPTEDDARNILEKFDLINLKKNPLKLEYHRVDSMRSDISVCGSDEEDQFPVNGEDNDDQGIVMLAESRGIPKDADDYNSVHMEDADISDFDDEEDEENEYGRILQRMRVKYNYLNDKCNAVGKGLSSVRKRLDGPLFGPESKAQPEEVLRQELREIGMMRRFIDSELDDDVRRVYLPYEGFHVSKSPEYIPYIKPKSTPNLNRSGLTVREAKRPTAFASYTRSTNNKKSLSKSLSSINDNFRRNLREANNWRLNPVSRKYDQGITVTSSPRRDGLPKSGGLTSTISGVGNDQEKTESSPPPVYVESYVPSRTVPKTSGFGIDYSKYEKCIQDTGKALELSPNTGKDKESILCEKQHGHYLSKCKQQTNDLVNKCENLNQKIQQLKSRFDHCEQLLSGDIKTFENVSNHTPTGSEEIDIPVAPSNEVLNFPTKRMEIENRNRKFTSIPLSKVTPLRSELAADFQNGSLDSDDEESVLERGFGNSLKKMHAECDSLQEKCDRSRRHLQEARKQMLESSTQLYILENVRQESRFENDLEDNELSDIMWKQNVLDDSFDSAYMTVTSGRSTGYSTSTRSRPNSSRSPFRDTMSTPRRLREEMSSAYSARSLDSALEDPMEDHYITAKTTIRSPQSTTRSLYSPGYGSVMEDPMEEIYVTAKSSASWLQTKTPVLNKSTMVTTNNNPRKVNSGRKLEDETDSFEDVELVLENEYGAFLDQCKSNFVNIEEKSLQLKREIRSLRVSMGLPTFGKQERKVSPVPRAKGLNRLERRNMQTPRLETKMQMWNTETRPEQWDLLEEDQDDCSITSFEKEMSVAEQSYGDFLSNMKSSYDSLNERSMRTKQEIHDVRRRLLEPTVCDTITCRDAYRHSYPSASLEF